MPENLGSTPQTDGMASFNPLLQLVDVARWEVDDYFATYPEGARDKRAYFPPGDCEFPRVNHARRHLFKLSDKRYPEQYWGEIIAYHIGKMVGVTVPPAYPAIDSSRRESGALIEWFYEDDEFRFFPGGLFMQSMVPDFDMKKGSQHNFRDIRVLCRTLRRKYPSFDNKWLETWAKGLMFDALIGNTDRHQNNWGVLFTAQGTPSPSCLAPWFDNGTSLGYDRWPSKVERWPAAHFMQYLYNGQHHLRWRRESTARCGFFEMPSLLLGLDAGLRETLVSCVKSVNIEALAALLEQCKSLSTFVQLSDWRAGFILRLVESRQALLLKAIS